jgi:hypothetical protein
MICCNATCVFFFIVKVQNLLETYKKICFDHFLVVLLSTYFSLRELDDFCCKGAEKGCLLVLIRLHAKNHVFSHGRKGRFCGPRHAVLHAMWSRCAVPHDKATFYEAQHLADVRSHPTARVRLIFHLESGDRRLACP